MAATPGGVVSRPQIKFSKTNLRLLCSLRHHRRLSKLTHFHPGQKFVPRLSRDILPTINIDRFEQTGLDPAPARGTRHAHRKRPGRSNPGFLAFFTVFCLIYSVPASSDTGPAQIYIVPAPSVTFPAPVYKQPRSATRPAGIDTHPVAADTGPAPVDIVPAKIDTRPAPTDTDP